MKMIEKYNQILEDLRAGQIALSDFLYEEGEDEEGHPFDKNSVKRFQLLIALQYNRAISDEDILVELLKAEIENQQKVPSQGMHPALKLNAFLVSKHSNPEYAILFLEAKRANFDTHCGFDYQFLVSAGISETYNFIEQERSEIKKAFYEYVGESVNDCYVSESELSEWKKYVNEEYPEELILDGILDEIDLAINLNETEILNEKIEKWRNSKDTWTELELNRLYHYKRIVDDVPAQIWANEELLKLQSSDWDCASQLQRLSELLIKNNQFDQAWNRIKDSLQYLNRISDWKTVGLGRFIVENAFDVVLGIKNQQDANVKEAFQWASKTIMEMKDLHHNLLEKASQAGEFMGDVQMRDKYSRILKREREKLDRMLNRR